MHILSIESSSFDWLHIFTLVLGVAAIPDIYSTLPRGLGERSTSLGLILS